MAMMTQINELTKDRHTQMFLLEFTEAICRVADRLSVISEAEYDYLASTEENKKYDGS